MLFRRKPPKRKNLDAQTLLELRQYLEIALRDDVMPPISYCMPMASAPRAAGNMRIVPAEDVCMATEEASDSLAESLEALEKLTNEAGGIIAGKAAVLAEGAAADREDIIFLEKLPVFPK